MWPVESVAIAPAAPTGRSGSRDRHQRHDVGGDDGPEEQHRVEVVVAPSQPEVQRGAARVAVHPPTRADGRAARHPVAGRHPDLIEE
jgi:hypothetical protein